MYRGRPWTTRQYAGFGSAAESNRATTITSRQGVKGLSVAFDLPTQIGLRLRQPARPRRSRQSRRRHRLPRRHAHPLRRIPLERVSTSMTINSTAAILLALYVAVGKKQGANLARLSGTVQNDILKEYIARGTYIYPVRPAMRIVTDIFAGAAAKSPTGTPFPSPATTCARLAPPPCRKSPSPSPTASPTSKPPSPPGSTVEQFAPQLSASSSTRTTNFLDEVAKFRAARRLWARIMRERFGAKSIRAR